MKCCNNVEMMKIPTISQRAEYAFCLNCGYYIEFGFAKKNLLKQMREDYSNEYNKHKCGGKNGNVM